MVLQYGPYQRYVHVFPTSMVTYHAISMVHMAIAWYEYTLLACTGRIMVADRRMAYHYGTMVPLVLQHHWYGNTRVHTKNGVLNNYGIPWYSGTYQWYLFLR